VVLGGRNHPPKEEEITPSRHPKVERFTPYGGRNHPPKEEEITPSRHPKVERFTPL